MLKKDATLGLRKNVQWKGTMTCETARLTVQIVVIADQTWDR